MSGLRERIAEALGYPAFLSDDVKKADVDRVMVEVQRDLDAAQVNTARYHDAFDAANGRWDAAEADAARLAEALEGYQNHAAPHEDEFTTEDVWRYDRARAALAAHREREKETNDG